MPVISVIVACGGEIKAGFTQKECTSYIGPIKTINWQVIGPKTCLIVSEQSLRNVNGLANRQLEIGIIGSMEGYTPQDVASRHSGYFSDVPEFAIAQRGDLDLYVHGILNYQAEKGSGMTLFIPESAAVWNGKLYILAHGSAQYPLVGELVSRKPHQYNRFTGNNSYVGLMIDKVYASPTRDVPVRNLDPGVEARRSLVMMGRPPAIKQLTITSSF